VLTATRLEAEAQIRQFRAEIEAEEIRMRRRIITETRGLLDNDVHRKKLNLTREKQIALWTRQRDAYLAGTININQLLQARRDLRSTDIELAQNTYGSESRERRLMGALGVIYDVVGLDIEASTRRLD
jgi:outer membrane protein TolC